jgi:hypothetical protein
MSVPTPPSSSSEPSRDQMLREIARLKAEVERLREIIIKTGWTHE